MKQPVVVVVIQAARLPWHAALAVDSAVIHHVMVVNVQEIDHDSCGVERDEIQTHVNAPGKHEELDRMQRKTRKSRRLLPPVVKLVNIFIEPREVQDTVRYVGPHVDPQEEQNSARDQPRNPSNPVQRIVKVNLKGGAKRRTLAYRI